MPNNLYPDSPNLRLTKQRALVNLAMKIFDSHVAQAYDGRTNKDPNEIEKNRQLKEILSIDSNDTIPEVLLKIIIFYVLGDRISQAIEEYIAINKRYADKDANHVYARVYFVPNKKFINGKYAKGKYVKVPNIIESNTHLFAGMTLTIGMKLALYTFTDGSQIKVMASSEEEAHRFINAVLPCCKPEFRMGSSEEHTYFGKPPKDAEKLKLNGLTVTAKHLRLYEINGTPKGTKVFL